MGTEEPARESVLSAPGHVLVRKAGSETVLLNLRNEHYYGLEGVGARFWELVEGNTTFGDAVDVLGSEYDVAVETLQADLVALSTDLRENGLLLVDGS
jgi:Coenzyme PQQ synthesis protein D (PqqD)